MPRTLIGTVLELLANDVVIQDSETICLAVRIYAKSRQSFDACLTAARSTLTGFRVETFNKNWL